MKRMFAAAVLLAPVVTPAVASAAILWDQYTPIGITNAVQDQVFTDFPTSSLFLVNDITVEVGGWNISSVSTLVSVPTSLAAWQGNVTMAHLNIFPKTGILPVAGDNPAASTPVSITSTQVGSNMELLASGLDIDLAAGSYWIGLTPIGAYNVVSIAYHHETPVTVGDPTAARNPGGNYGFGTNWGTLALVGQPANDTTLRIQGTSAVPEPASITVLGLATLILSRRRRRAAAPHPPALGH